MKKLVLYYSRTGSTRYVSGIIAKELAADICEIIQESDYSGALGYLRAGKDASLGKTGTITDLGKNPSDYDLLVIAQPVWAFTMIPAIRGLCKKYEKELSGKKVCLVCTMDGSGDRKAFVETQKLLPRSDVILTQTFIKVLKNKEASEKASKEFAKKILALVSKPIRKAALS